jgi:two-component system, LytTR family, response regulator
MRIFKNTLNFFNTPALHTMTAIDALAAKLERHCPQVKILATFTNPKEAAESITYHNPEMIFIDVEMPIMDGFEVVRQIKNNTAQIIFVTAYNHYAVKAIRANAFDYLEKPVDVKQLKETIKRIERKKEEEQSEVAAAMPDNTVLEQLLKSVKQLQSQSQSATISLNVSEGINIVRLSEIVRLESLSNYTRFHLSDGKQLVVSKTMGEYEELLLQNNFFRIHRSHIINLNYLRHFHKNNEAWVEMKDGSKVEVSDRRRKELTERLQSFSS